MYHDTLSNAVVGLMHRKGKRHFVSLGTFTLCLSCDLSFILQIRLFPHFLVSYFFGNKDGSFEFNGARYEVHPHASDNGMRVRGFEEHVAHIVTRAESPKLMDEQIYGNILYK